MKQSIKIVTIPLPDKQIWNIGDIMKSPSGDRTWLINDTNIGETLCFWKRQQLLVLSDDDIQRNDSFYHSVCNKVFKATSEDVARIKLIKPNYYARKVIASYPQLEGTQPISKETIQQWIDIGTPGEGNVEIKHKCTGRNTIGTTPSGEPIKMNSFIETLNLDSQGNLILEFNRPLEEVMDSVFSKWKATDKIVNDFLESKVKEKTYTQHEFLSELKKVPSEQRKQWAETNKHLIRIIPTDEEIEDKATCRIANQNIKPETNKHLIKHVPTDEEIEEKAAWWIGNQNIKKETLDEENEIIYAYTCGYQEALKDLGYDN